MKPFFYIIKHRITKMIYAGYCSSRKHCNSNTFMTHGGYKTSSKLIKEIITKEGIDIFDIVRIKHFSTPQDACHYEARFLNKVDAMNNLMFYNQSNGGKDFRVKFCTDETRAKMSKAARGKKFSEEHNKKISAFRKKFIYTPEMCANISKGKLGKRHTDEQRRQRSKRQLGFIHTIETKQKISSALKQYIKSPEHRRKISETLRGRPTSIDLRQKRKVNMTGRCWWNDSQKTKFCHECPGEGWTKGRL